MNKLRLIRSFHITTLFRNQYKNCTMETRKIKTGINCISTNIPSPSSSITKLTNVEDSPSTSRQYCSLSYSNVDEEISLLYDKISKSDFGASKEFSVIHTNRSLNLMSDPFQKVMNDLNNLLKKTYNASKVAIIPGSGTFGMEAVARQFATNEHVFVIRNGWFSYRWTEIFDMGRIPASHTVLKAKSICNSNQYFPYPIDQVLDQIKKHKPSVVFAPHVETSTGIILPHDYIKCMSNEVHKYGGLLFLDCIASGCVWVNMKELGIDVVISAPQKGWTGPACAGLIMMSEHAVTKMSNTKETSYAMSLKKWSGVMDAYENGRFAYHTTMPTDALRDFHEITVEMMKFGFFNLRVAQQELGNKARKLMNSKGLLSVAAAGFEAPGVLVYYSPTGVDNPFIVDSFKVHGLQIATGVPWKINEPEDLKTFRIGLFGLDKLSNIPETLNLLDNALDKVLEDCRNINL